LDLAAFYSSQPVNDSGTTDPQFLSLGERLYRGGNKEVSLSACIACHGPNGRGNAAAGFPALAGQHAKYVANQLRAYRAGERRSDANQMMRNIAARLTDAEIEAVASYIQGLH
ncbi:MAG: c-type cytochrome, partial [Gammaproteobacteria bacterium]|nr:c-type cytochrome [Gammaproteobacteria bacterium]